MGNGWSSTGVRARNFRTDRQLSVSRRESGKLLSEPKPQPDKRSLQDGAADVEVVVPREQLEVGVVHSGAAMEVHDPGTPQRSRLDGPEQVHRLGWEGIKSIEEVEPTFVVAVVQQETRAKPGVHHQPLILDEAVGYGHIADPQFVAAAALEFLGIVVPVGLHPEARVGVEEHTHADAGQAVEVAPDFGGSADGVPIRVASLGKVQTAFGLVPAIDEDVTRVGSSEGIVSEAPVELQSWIEHGMGDDPWPREGVKECVPESVAQDVAHDVAPAVGGRLVIVGSWLVDRVADRIELALSACEDRNREQNHDCERPSHTRRIPVNEWHRKWAASRRPGALGRLGKLRRVRVGGSVAAGCRANLEKSGPIVLSGQG